MEKELTTKEKEQEQVEILELLKNRGVYGESENEIIMDDKGEFRIVTKEEKEFLDPDVSVLTGIADNGWA